MSKFLRMSIQDFSERHTKETYSEGVRVIALKHTDPCEFLDGKGQCTVYAVRPNSCMFYPFLSFGIQTDVERIIVPQDCPTGMKVAEYLRGRETFARTGCGCRKEESQGLPKTDCEIFSISS